MIFKKHNNGSTNKDFEQFLKEYNCSYEKEDQKDNAWPYLYKFYFQGKQFIAKIGSDKKGFEVLMPNVATVPFDQVELVRIKCNEYNNANLLLKFTYTADETDNTITVNASFFNNTVDNESIAHELGAAFHFAREWKDDYKEAVEIIKNGRCPDLESEFYLHKRELFLIRQQELSHQEEHNLNMRLPLTLNEGFMLKDLLELVAPLPSSQLMFMTVNTADGQKRVDQECDILNYNLRRTLVDGWDDDMRFIRDYAVLDLHYQKSIDKKPYVLSVMLTAEGDDGDTLYQRLTVTIPPMNASRHHSLSNAEEREPKCMSMLFATDRRNCEQRQQEFDYMWKDALLKLKNGETLSEEQELLCQVKDFETGYNWYWGNKLFNNGRYLEALYHLTNIFETARSEFYDRNEEDRRYLLDVAYKIGFCYNELKLYKEAFYYLNLVSNDGSISHAMEYINTLANNKDLRVFQYTDQVMQTIREHYDNKDNEEVPEHITDFVSFMRRRRGYSLINFGQLDQAEKIFTAMLNEEDNADYAINELAYIKKLRGDDTEDDKETPEQ